MRFSSSLATSIACSCLVGQVAAQTFRRLGTCPTLGCVFPPDQADFLPGQYFDIRLEVHAPLNGSEASLVPSGNPDTEFTFTIEKEGGGAVPVTQFFGVEETEIERWNFTYYETLFTQTAETPVFVDVAAKAYRKVALYEPGNYIATLNYYGDSQTVANWTVRAGSNERKAKNTILFIGDGMAQSFITAARLMAHKIVNGKYQSTMAIDKFPITGLQMTHSIDSFITDSANSATALNTGHKSTVNALGVYADSSPDTFDDPKVETMAEMVQNLLGGGIGIISTAYIADATPAALNAHTRDRGEYAAIVDGFLNGYQNYSWVDWKGPDVLFGGGAEQFYPNEDSFLGRDYYAEFANQGYNVVNNATALAQTPNDERTLGIFTTGNLAVWLDRNIYKDNLNVSETDPFGGEGAAIDQPGLKEMTLKGLEILQNQYADEGFFMMVEAASIDKMMHVLDYDRALTDTLELDDVIRATIEHLTRTGDLADTQIVVTADHGHGFDVMGSVDTVYLQAQDDDRMKRGAVGVYEQSGLSQYVNPNTSAPVGSDKNAVYPNGEIFPNNFDPRYTFLQGACAFPDRRENYIVHKDGPRTPAVPLTEDEDDEDYYANPEDSPGGYVVNGTLPVGAPQGVHSLVDVSVFAMGPCQMDFAGVYNSIDIFFKMADCMGLARYEAPTNEASNSGSSNSTSSNSASSNSAAPNSAAPNSAAPNSAASSNAAQWQTW